LIVGGILQYHFIVSKIIEKRSSSYTNLISCQRKNKLFLWSSMQT